MIIRVVDVETTGFPPNAGIVEVGMCDIVVGPEITISAPKAWLCNPGKPISPGAMGVHHITDEDIANAPPADDVVAGILNDPDVVAYAAHNAPFEEKFITFDKPIICTYKLAKMGNADAPDHKNQTLRYYLGVDSEEDFDINLAMPPHRAGPDTYVTAFILRRMLRALGGDVNRLLDISQRPAPPRLLKEIKFGKYKGTPFAQIESGYLQWILANPKAEPDVLFTARHYLKQRGIMV